MAAATGLSREDIGRTWRKYGPSGIRSSASSSLAIRGSAGQLPCIPAYATTSPNEYWAEGVQWWFFSNYGECFAGDVKLETPEDLAAYDPTLHELISRVFDTHHIPMDVYHARRVRPVDCPEGGGV